ncbi:MAG TPA: hypothetical protein VJ746_07560 [Nitrospira sp.]|nr:hypothetical protein [Nitrospira sp.]
MRHPLEDHFNASAWDIMSAIQRGFRAQVDVKGKLAEYFLNKALEKLVTEGTIQECIWQDKDGEPDFIIKFKGRQFRIECKNVRSKGLFRDPPGYKVEIQKTRNAIGGGPARGYKVDEFDVLAACLFNQTHEWTYVFSATAALARREYQPKFLQIMQPVPKAVIAPWSTELVPVLMSIAEYTK